LSEAISSIQNKIDNYQQTIIAMVGFMNFYRYDSNQNPIILFQGRKLSPTHNDRVDFVTPDIGVLLPDDTGILGEVKHSFPKERDFWMRAFEQLMKYDDDLDGWPNNSGKVSTHDLVLLTHQSRARVVGNYYREKATTGEVNFMRPFSIVEYNQTSQREEYFFFRVEEGELSDEQVNSSLQEGVSVPMMVLLNQYAAVKLYDDMPELPYLMFIIWVYVVLERAFDNELFSGLAKNQKLDVVLTVDEIVEALRDGYSFRILNTDNSDRQPQIPKKAWVKKACQKFVKWGEAKWNDDQKTSITFKCHKKYTDALKHFIEEFVKEGEVGQQTLFKEVIDNEE